MENYSELNDEKIQEWIFDGKEQVVYTYKDWLEEKPIPDEFWIFDKKKSIQLGYEVFSGHLNKISESLHWAWDFVLQIEIEEEKKLMEWQLSLIDDLKEKCLFLELEKKHCLKYLKKSKIRKKDVFLKNVPAEIFDLIDAKTYLRIKKCSDNSKPLHVLGEIKNDYFNAIIKDEIIKFIDLKIKNLSNPVQSEKLENLQHKLCLLDDLGFLTLIEERFKNTNYRGTSRETDKASLIASLLDIEDSEKVRNTLRKGDYKSRRQIKNAIQTLQNHGLESKNFTD
ncbi:hypothetical protein [Cyclobacterium amurskyense]|uniref:Uncharacterized protein n=1 Tax=Cyclobacterium amurskyense TaxID=320787 RepID=A0A0H4P8F2_9BACT|nr:hypothetical protein [Cyclobacterium amurskyense]AKP50746.1 hypothetical protein CA2015_1299 [Cyclobacterium amurskyense]